MNGDIDYGGRNAPFSVGTVATYFCNTGYALVDGPDSKTCVESDEGTGVFDPPQTPICDRESINLSVGRLLVHYQQLRIFLLQWMLIYFFCS